MLRFLLAFQILYTVYQDHYVFETGIPGVNVPNLLFLTVFVLILATRRSDEPRGRAFLLGPLLIFFATLCIAFVIAQVRAPGDLLSDATYLKNAMFSPLLYLLYLNCRQSEKDTRFLIIIVMAVTAIAGVQAVRQGLDYGFGGYVESHRASGPFATNYSGANRAGVYYAIFLPMFLALALFLRRDMFWRLAAIAGTAVLSIALLATYSRQSYFIGIFGLAILLLRRSLVWAVILGSVLVVAAGYLPDSVTERVEQTQQTGKHGEETVDESTASRWEIWTGALAMWENNPEGVGLDRFKKEIGNYSAFKGYDAHNFYVLTFAECGPQGLAALLWLMWAIFRQRRFLLRGTPPENTELRALVIGYSVAALCMALGNLYGSPFFTAPVMGTFWILAGLLERQVRFCTAGETTVDAPLPSPAETIAERFPLAARARPRRS